MAAAIAAQQQGNLPEATRLYRALLEQHPDNAAVLHNLAIVDFAAGRMASGISHLERAQVLGIDPAVLPQTTANAGLALFRAGHREHALPWLEQAVRLAAAPDPEVARALDLCRPRDYLAPEVYDPLADETLLRYSPRESATYVYTIDVVGTCNLRCPSCPVGNSSPGGRTRGHMSLELFDRVISKIEAERPTETPEVWLFNWGEPLLHPELPALVKRVHAAGFPVHLSSNLNIETGLRDLVKAQPDVLKVSISGFSQATYGVTHRRGNVDLVKSNLYRLRHLLDKYGAATRVWVGQHVYRNNHHEVQPLANLCAELGFEHHPVQAFFQPIEKLVAIAEGNLLASDQPLLEQLLMHPADYLAHIRATRSGDYDCELRFNQTVINHDGSVALCCGVYDQANQLGVQFLDVPHAELEALKYRHSFCATCRRNGCDYAIGEPVDAQA